MWYDIFTVLTIVHLVIAVVALIGYWTYADYITKINTSYKHIYFVFEIVCICITLEFSVMQWLFKDFESGVYTATICLGVTTFVALVVLAICMIVSLFFKSREYFGKKRNKV